MRLRYLTEVDVLKRNLGSLESVRMRLGLSRRKMCQLLLVDPSAWTRWTRDESKVPPHIWKMLALILKTDDIQTKFLNEVLLEPVYRDLNRAKKLNKSLFLLTFLALFLAVFSIFYNA